ncbi:MAG: protein translocase subunit SecF [Bacilli bacterium]
MINAKRDKKKLIITLLSITLALVLSICLLKPVFSKLHYGLDLKGGFEVLYKVSPLEGEKKIDKNMLLSTYKALNNRIDTLGVSETDITIEGENIRVKLPGVKDEAAARERLNTPAVLSFRDTSDNLLMSASVLGSPGASLDYDKDGTPVVKLNIKDNDTFYSATKKISTSKDKTIVIWLDFNEGDTYKANENICGKDGNMKCISSATVEEAFAGNVVIKGKFTTEQANNLIDLINSGSLPTKLTEVSTKTVDASFGANTLNITALAGLITFIIITLIMSFKYKVSGLLASVALAVYIILVFIFFNLIGSVLTLTGIAALILGIGMAIDSSVICIEKVKDELRSGKKLETAFKSGNKRSLVTIIDANLTTFIVALVLFIFGESSVKGFATMLMLTIIVTVISMVFIYRYLLKKLVETGYFTENTNILLGKIGKVHEFKFSEHFKKYLIPPVIIVLVGIVFAFTVKPNLGIDFAGGTDISIKSDIQIDEKELDKVLSTYEVRSKTLEQNNKEASIIIKETLKDKEVKELKSNIEKNGYSANVSAISNVAKQELTKNAFISLIIASLLVVVYVAFRFTTAFGIAAVLALFHDVIITLSLFIIFKVEINFIFVAAVLTIIGYSINDTIVVFDRIRENKTKLYNDRTLTLEEMKHLVNVSLSETLTRNIITTVTTLVSVIVLMVLGASEIFGFNAAILVGLIAGAYSSIFIAANLWVVLEQKNAKKPKKIKPITHELEEKEIRGINTK